MCKCCRCRKEFDPEIHNGNHWQYWQRERYCSQSCKTASERAYDNYVAPLGFYQAKAVDPYE